MVNIEKYEEWFFQSDYDMETAVDMFKQAGLYIVFLCAI